MLSVISEGPIRMLVLKRAISLLLSFVLVYSPSLAWARAGEPRVKHFKAENPDVYKRQVLKHPHKASKLQVHVDKRMLTKAHRKPASEPKDLKSKIDSAIEQVYRPIRYKGHDYTVTQVAGRGKHLKSQMIKGDDFEQIMVDEYNTGTASLWKVTKGATEITASHPYKGKFSQIDIRERRTKSFINAHLQINPDLKTYRVANYRIEPFQVDHYDSQIALACTSQLNDISSIGGIDSLKEFLSTIGADRSTPQSALECKLGHLQEAIFDKSCYVGEFAGSANDMSLALANIFGSVDPKHKGKARYLQCLNEQGFAYNAAQMEGNFVAMTSMVEQAVDNNSVRPAAASLLDANLCTPIDQIDILQGTTLVRQQSLLDLPPPAGLFKPFTCDAKLKYDSVYKSDTTRQIVFGMGSGKMALPANYGNAADGYASLMFHEMLHQSGIREKPNEHLVDQLQSCCADPDPNSANSKKSCADLNVYTQQSKLLAVQDSPMSIYIHGYSDLSDLANAQMGDQSDAFKAQWVAGLIADPNASAAWAELKRCDDASPNDTRACDLGAQKALKKYNDSFMDQQCPKFRATSATKNSISCSALKETFNHNLKSSDISSLPIPILAGITNLSPISYVPAESIQHALSTFKPPDLAVAEVGEIANGSIGRSTSGSDVATNAATEEPEIVVTARHNKGKAQSAAAKGKTNKQAKSSQPTAVAANGRSQTTSGGDQTVSDGRAVNSGGGIGIDRTNSGANVDPNSNATDATDVADSSNTTNSGDSTNGQSQAAANQTANASLTSTNSIQSNGSTFVPTSRSTFTNQASGQVMPANPVDASHALPASTGTYAPTFNNSTQTAGAIASAAASGASAITNAATAIFDPLLNQVARIPAVAAQVAQARMPSSVSYSSPSPNSNASRPSSRAIAGDDPSSKDSSGIEPAKKLEKADGAGDQETAARDPSQESLRSIDPKVAAAEIKSFSSKQFTGPNDAVFALQELPPQVLARELDRGPSSLVIKKLLAIGWTLRVRNKQSILMNPSRRCFARDPRRTLVQLKSCE